MYNNFYNTNIDGTPKRDPVGMVKRSAKIIPVGTKQPNEVNNNISAINCVKAQIYAVLLTGVNRYYLLQSKTPLLIVSYVYSITIASLVFINMYRGDTHNVSHSVFKYSLCFEYFVIVIASLVSSKGKLTTFFRDLNEFDQKLNLSIDLKIIDSGYVCFCWILGSLLYIVIDYIFVYNFLYFFVDGTFWYAYIIMLTHDYEQIMFFMLLRTINLRLRILKAHVAKMFNVEERTGNHRKEVNKVEALSNNTCLDITSLHQVYDLLHQCADQLNSTMSLPMSIILLTAGLSTTMLFKIMVMVIQSGTTGNPIARASIFHMFSHALKYTALVIISCYYSSITSTQVAAIRIMLHDAIHSFPLDKLERRKVKAFFQLTKENEFAYALCGVIRLNMSLPLSYMSLCTTYLVISIQFSKFFDS